MILRQSLMGALVLVCVAGDGLAQTGGGGGGGSGIAGGIAPPPVEPSREDRVPVLDSEGSWGVYQDTNDGGQKICWSGANPNSTVPAGRPTDDVFLLIARRPAEGVVEEISVVTPDRVREGDTVTAKVDGNDPYTLFSQDGGIWIRGRGEEVALVNEMRGGTSLLVEAETTIGTRVGYRFPLTGLAGALRRVEEICES